MVACAGNSPGDGNGMVVYPAAFDFGATGKVIAVSATYDDNGTEKFKDGYNFCPPNTDFIDVAAPGVDIRTLDRNQESNYSTASVMICNTAN